MKEFFKKLNSRKFQYAVAVFVTATILVSQGKISDWVWFSAVTGAGAVYTGANVLKDKFLGGGSNDKG